MSTLPYAGCEGSDVYACAGSSPVTRSRQISTWSIPTSSSAQPVTANDPCIPVVPSAGVSKAPNGDTVAPGREIESVTGIDTGEFGAVGDVMVMLPESDLLAPITSAGFW